MKECYRLDKARTVWELEEIGDVWYQRLKKIKTILDTETDASRVAKAKRIFLSLTIILEKMVVVTAHAHKPMPPGFPVGGLSSSIN